MARTPKVIKVPQSKPKLPGDSELLMAAAVLPDYVLASIKNLSRGEATEPQQILALNFIIEDLCGAYDLSYRPDRTVATAFNEGRRFVGLQLRKHIMTARKD
jgi:hypothetical protein